MDNYNGFALRGLGAEFILCRNIQSGYQAE